jgi:hypothetical protein
MKTITMKTTSSSTKFFVLRLLRFIRSYFAAPSRSTLNVNSWRDAVES